MSKPGVRPSRPTTLTPLIEAVLESLGREPLSANLILGGGVALKHYDDFRPTNEIHAWWAAGSSSPTLERLGVVLERVANAHGDELEHRKFGATDSFEFRKGGKKKFSFQIAVRDVSLEPPLQSPWPPLLLE